MKTYNGIGDRITGVYFRNAMTTNKINEAIEIILSASKDIADASRVSFEREALHRIATLAAAEEREACARICDLHNVGISCAACDGAKCEHVLACVATSKYQSAIRARGQGNKKTV